MYIKIPKNQISPQTQNELELVPESIWKESNIINAVKQYSVMVPYITHVVSYIRVVESWETPIKHEWKPIAIIDGLKNIWVCCPDIEACPIEAIIDNMALENMPPIEAFKLVIYYNAEHKDPYAVTISDIWGKNIDVDEYVDIDELIDETLEYVNNAYKFEFKTYMLEIKKKVMDFYR